MSRRLIVITAAFLLLAGALPAFAADGAPKERAWDEETVQIASTIPIQDGGRIKPMSTFARFRLIAMCGKSTLKDPVYGKMEPMPWLLNVLFFPEDARKYKLFVVQDSEVLDGIGLTDIVKKKRDNYSFNDLEPGFDELFKLAREYSKIEPKNRTPVEEQIVNLAFNLDEFNRLATALDFARHYPELKGSPALAAMFPRPEDHRLSGLLAKAGEIRRLTESLTRSGEEQQAELAAINRVLGVAERNLSRSTSLAIFPPSVSREKQTEWLAPAELFRLAFAPGSSVEERSSVEEQIALLGGLEELVHVSGDQSAFKERLTAVQSGVRKLAEKRGEYKKVELEVSFYRGGYFTWSLVLFILGFVLVALCWLLPKVRFVPVVAATPLFVGLVFLTIGITMRCIIRGRPPVSTLYETILFITAVAVLSGLLIELMTRRRIALGMASIIGVAGMFLASRYEISQAVDTMPSLVAVLDTNFWLATHVTTISIGYSAGLLAAAIAHVYIFGKLFGVARGDPQFYKSIARMVYGTVIFCLFCSVLGTLLGGVWANESWGRFWGWDPKENGALLICLWMLAIVHAHIGGYLKDLGVAIATVGGGIVVAFSWWGVNLLGVGLHSYGFTQGVMRSLLGFVALELVVMALGGVVWLMGKAAADAVKQ